MLIILFFILPWNLGKHFEQSSSLVNTSVIPYLIPTLYLQDIVVVAIVALLFQKERGTFKGDGHALRLFFLFIVAAFLSVFFADRFYPSGYFFVRLLLYFLFFLASINSFRSSSVRRWFFVSLALNLFLLSVLGFLQFYKQSSVFNNYLFFGEQPYNVFTPFIAKESFSGVTKIPPYATFLHPNIFAGYLAVSLILLLGYFLTGKKRRVVPSAFFVLIGVVALFLTKSYTAWAAFVLGLLLLSLARPVSVKSVKDARLITSILLFLAFATVLLGLLFPSYKNLVVTALPADSITSTLSVERRSALLNASYKMVSQKPFFGWGINSFTYSFEPFYTRFDVVRFLQPVHNVYALIAAEVGILGAVLFLLLTFYTIYRSTCRGGFLYSVALIQVVFLSSFDHYFFTIPQTQLLFILTLIMGLTYTGDSSCL